MRIATVLLGLKHVLSPSRSSKLCPALPGFRGPTPKNACKVHWDSIFPCRSDSGVSGPYKPLRSSVIWAQQPWPTFIKRCRLCPLATLRFDALTQFWAQKLDFIRGWQNLNELKLEAPDKQQLLLQGRDLEFTMRGFDQPIYRNPFPDSGFDEPPHHDADVWHFLKQAAAAADIESSAIISNQGWEGSRVSVDQKLKGECCVLE